MKQVIKYVNEMTSEMFDTPIEAIASEREYLDRFDDENDCLTQNMVVK